MGTDTEVLNAKEMLMHRVKNYDAILSAIKEQDKLRKKVEGKSSTEIIRKWRDAR